MAIPENRKIKEPAYVAETLKWCNFERKKQGKKPLKKLPKGEKDNGKSCPCGKATRLRVGTITFDATDGQNYPLPFAVIDFVAAFDSGKLPQYEL